MKRWLALLLVLVLCFSLCACGGSKADADDADEEEDDAPKSVLKTDTVSIDLLAVDDSYRDKDESPIRMVYVFYTLTPQDENMRISTNTHHMKINDANDYGAEHFPGATDMVPSYYNGDYIKDVYVGSEMKVCATFKVPEGDLAAGKSVSLSYDEVPDLAELKFTTDDFKHFDSMEALAAEADPEGLAAWNEGHEPADEDTIDRVKAAVNGYQWDFYVNSTSYQLEFFDPNQFELRALGMANGGTYEVLKGYVVLKYDNGNTVEIPYTWGADDIDLDVIEGFDVRG